MDLCACILGQAAEEGSGREGGWRTQIPHGVFVLDDDIGKTEVAPGPPQHEALDATTRQSWWQADAWAETTLDAPTFLLTLTYESLPTLFSGPLCWFIEGKASAQNRMLLPCWQHGCAHQRAFVMQSTFTTLTWVLFILWQATRPDEVPPVDVTFPFMLLMWRAACIAMKYAYLSPSDLDRLRRSAHFTRTKDNVRILGVHKFFNVNGTLVYDQMEHLLKAALRSGMLEEAKVGYLTVAPSVARHVWEQLKGELEPSRISQTLSKNIPKASGWTSKYGDVQDVLGLASVSAIDEQVSTGKLPVVVVAYYFIHKARQGGVKRTTRVALLMCSGLLLGFLHPLVLHLTGKASFGTSAAGNAIYGIRVICVAQLLMPMFLYLIFPVLDSQARFLMSWSLMSSFGRGEARARRLCRGFKDPHLKIQRMSDLRAFWCLGRLLGPAYEAGVLIRYSSACIAVHVLFMCLATGGLLFSSMRGLSSWGVSAELTVIFVAGSVSVVVASLFCMNLNWQVPMYVGLARQAALQFPELGGVAKDVCNDFYTEHLVINPVQVMYIPATPALLSILWSGIVMLAGIFFASLPSVCVPLLFARGCSAD